MVLLGLNCCLLTSQQLHKRNDMYMQAPVSQAEVHVQGALSEQDVRAVPGKLNRVDFQDRR